MNMSNKELVTQPTMMPTRKVTAFGITGAGTTALIWIAAQAGVDIPAEVAATIVTAVASVAGWLVRERKWQR